MHVRYGSEATGDTVGDAVDNLGDDTDDVADEADDAVGQAGSVMLWTKPWAEAVDQAVERRWLLRIAWFGVGGVQLDAWVQVIYLHLRWLAKSAWSSRRQTRVSGGRIDWA